ncbi:hypothetical protein [Streptomyces sp. R08]|uniref:Uncharacterized protein n=1 Tax=Streptomyces sp. R08 TaxID=3238624 RepID=A0AB39MPF5_9ACTN
MNRTTHNRALEAVVDILGRARGLNRDLTRDLDLARDLTRDNATRDRDFAVDLAFDRALDLEHALSRAYQLVVVAASEPDLIRDRGLTHQLASASASASDLDHQLAVALASDLDLDPDLGGVVRDVVRSLESAERNVALLVDAGDEPAAGGSEARVSGWARWLVGVASRVVPVRERARYVEEWRYELWELGKQAQGRRRHQIRYALRVLSKVWGVRSGVRAARRRPAGG